MPLDREHPPVVGARLEALDDAVWSAASNSKARSYLEDTLMMQRVHCDVRLTDCFRELRSFLQGDIVNACRPVFPRIVAKSIWNFRGYILNQGSSEGHVQQLWTTADRQDRKAHFARCLHECDLGAISGEVGFTAFWRSGLSIKRRLYIFAAGEKQSVHAG